VLDDLIEQVISAAATEPAVVQIRAAMRTSRELQAIDAASDRRIAGLLAAALRQRGVRARRDRLEAGLLVLVTSIGAVLDRAALDSDDGDRAALVREESQRATSPDVGEGHVRVAKNVERETEDLPGATHLELDTQQRRLLPGVDDVRPAVRTGHPGPRYRRGLSSSSISYSTSRPS
jgi:hypothetical protein